MAQADACARRGVHILPGTEILAGSNVHLGIGMVLNDCVTDSVILSHRKKPKENKNTKNNTLSSNVANVLQVNDGVSYLEKQYVSINLSPNPASDNINISLLPNEENAELSKIEIINTLGQMVYSCVANGNYKLVSVNQLTKGAYIVRCYDTNANVSFHNFLKQ